MAAAAAQFRPEAVSRERESVGIKLGKLGEGFSYLPCATRIFLRSESALSDSRKKTLKGWRKPNLRFGTLVRSFFPGCKIDEGTIGQRIALRPQRPASDSAH